MAQSVIANAGFTAFVPGNDRCDLAPTKKDYVNNKSRSVATIFAFYKRYKLTIPSEGYVTWG